MNFLKEINEKKNDHLTMVDRKRLLKIFRYLLISYANNTSVHGVKYIARKNACKTEKVIWTIVVLCGILTSTAMFIVVSNKFWSKPTLTSYSTRYVPVQYVPFPALTVCNMKQVSNSKVEALLHNLLNGSKSIEKITNLKKAFQPLFKNNRYSLNRTATSDLEKLLIKNQFDNLTKVIQTITYSCEEIFVSCTWQFEDFDCKEVFFEIFTPEGRCCTFNIIKVRRAFRTMYFGQSSGLKIVLNIPDDSTSFSNYVSNGVKVLIHTIGSDTSIATSVVLRQASLHLLNINSILLEMSRNNKNEISIKDRNCVFPNERKMLFSSRSYDFMQCVFECEANVDFLVCGCVPFYNRFSNHPVCSLVQMICVLKISVETKNEYLKNCNCPQPCKKIIYQHLLTSTSILNDSPTTGKQWKNITLTNNTICINAYFGKGYILPLYRNSTNSTVKFLSGVGGVFSLFLGCSIISIVEIIYYCLIRSLIVLR